MNMPSTFAAAVLALCSCLAPTAASASVDIGTILDKLKFTFMGSFEARNGRWGGFTDLIYIDLGETRLQTRDIVLDRRQVPAGVSGNVGSIALADRSASRRASLNHWDAIFGVKGQMSFGADRAWFVPNSADIGTGESDLTYHLMTGVGYAFKWGEMVAQWRYLD